LEEDVRDEKNEDDDRVSVLDEKKVDSHTSNDGNTRVGTIHQTDTVQETKSQDQATVNSPDNLLLLFRGESLNTGIVDLVGCSVSSSVHLLEVVDGDILLLVVVCCHN